jgi:pSer/pThr/pTyr-binding forkhead associated (FHA) protein
MVSPREKDEHSDDEIPVDASDSDNPFDGIAEETRTINLNDAPPSFGMAGPAGAIKVDPLPPDLHPRLEISAGPNRGKAFALKKPLVILGRVSDVADIVVPDHAASRHHAAIGYREQKFTLYDLGSTNGTFVDGNKVASVELKHGSELRIGDSVFTFWLE